MQPNIINNIIRPLKSIKNNKPKYIGYNTKSIFTKFLNYYCNDITFIEYLPDQIAINYDLYFHDRPEEYAFSIEQINAAHLPSLVYIRNPPPANIKKEDRFLIQQKLSKSQVVFQSPAIQELWFGNTNQYDILEYGIPTLSQDDKDRDSIIILNYTQSHNIKLLYSNVKQIFPDTTMLESIHNMNYLQICQILQKHKICITVGDNYDVLCAVSNGCKVISTDKIADIEYKYCDNLNELFATLPDFVGRHKDIDIPNPGISNYSVTNFHQSFNNIMDNMLRKPVII